MKKHILGLDLGTNSIGWALVEIDHEKKIVRIIGLGSRILPMNAGDIAKFETGGKLSSSAAQRTDKRSPRRLNERYLLRRDRLHCILNLLQYLPEHYRLSIEFENEKGKRSGKFKKGMEEKLAYYKDDNGKYQFLFMNAYKEMEKEFQQQHPNLFYIKNNGKQTKIPYDWTLYYLRKKALQATNNELTKEELAWITLSFNQKRGYEKVIGQDEKEQKEGELRETFTGKVKSATKIPNTEFYEIVLVDNKDNELYRYKEESKFQITFKDDLKEVEIVSKYDDDGNVGSKNVKYIINEIRNLSVTDVRNTERNSVFEIELETGWKEQQSKFTPKWKDTKRDFIIKTTYDKNGDRILKGKDKGRNIGIPEKEDWALVKLKTETSIHAFNTEHGTIGLAPFIYHNLLQNPNQKIKADLVTVIERDFYEEELKAIYESQEKFHPELKNKELYKQAIELLYPNNGAHRSTLANLSFKDLIGVDILFYQRDLKSKKALIADCEYEEENFEQVNLKTGKKYKKALKAIHTANPLYQEFRLWQIIKNLKIIKLEDITNDEIVLNQDVSKTLLSPEIKEKVFEFLNNKKEVTQSQLLKKLSEFHNDKTISPKDYKWNYPQYDDKEKKNEYKIVCNPTKYEFILRIKRIKGFDWEKFLCSENEYLLWHFFYSVKKKSEFLSGLNSLIGKLLKRAEISEEYKNDLVKNFSTFSGYKNDYGTYSEKAIKKLLPFLRLGKYWKQEDVERVLESRSSDVLEKVEKVLGKVIEKEGINGEISDFQGLWLSSACYLVYGRYSEVGDVKFWTSPYDIENFIKNEFKQHSLNNPVVEKVLIETLQVVKDIWMYYGEKTDGVDENGRHIYKKLFDRIHIELGREMKKNNKQKQNADKKNSENRKTNERIIELLKELKREYKSPFQQTRLKILEEGLLSSIEYHKDNVIYSNTISPSKEYPKFEISKKEIREFINKDISKVSKSELERYKLWLDQRYLSPYTKEVIKLSDLFDRKKYEIEHIFPQERITLNSLDNKVICETEVNKDKKADTGYGYILRAKEKEIFCAAHGKKVRIQSIESYEKLVKENFTGKKREILLSKDIPNEFTNSQKVNMQYISKMAVKLLSNIVREKDEDTYRSKNVLATNGQITSVLKQHWQLTETWNKLMSPRYERLNELTDSNLFGETKLINGHKVFVNNNQIPQQINKNFDSKRIDHRHHALDALIIALTTENHVNYLNNISSQEEGEDKLKTRKAIKYQLTNTRKGHDEEKEWYFLPPVQLRTKEGIVEYNYQYKNTSGNVFKNIVLTALEDTVASFKQKNRIIRQRWNKYSTYKDGKLGVKRQKKLEKKENFSVRQSLHMKTIYGKVKLAYKTKDISLEEAILEDYDIVDSQFAEQIESMKRDLSKNEIIAQLSVSYSTVKVYDKFVATRYGHELKSLETVSSDKIISVIEKITDTGIQQILKNHLKNCDSDPQKAFSCDGIKVLNDAIIEPGHGLTKKGKPHKPIYKVRKAYAMGTKFTVSEEGQKSTKYVVTDAGCNAFCGVYENNENRKRKFYIPTLREILNDLKNGENPYPNNHPNFPEYRLLFVLSVNDLVYLPTQDEIDNNIPIDIDNLDKSRIYKFVDGSGEILNFVPVNASSLLYDVSKKDAKEMKKEHLLEYEGSILLNELGLGNEKPKNQRAITGEMIKNTCIKLNIDRLGNISKA